MGCWIRYGTRLVPIVRVKCWKVAHWNAKICQKNCQKFKKLLPKFLHTFSFLTIIANIGQKKKELLANMGENKTLSSDEILVPSEIALHPKFIEICWMRDWGEISPFCNTQSICLGFLL